MKLREAWVSSRKRIEISGIPDAGFEAEGGG